MNSCRPSIVHARLVIAILLGAGCRGEVTAADTDDALARDSTLELQVLTAKHEAFDFTGAESKGSTRSRPIPASARLRLRTQLSTAPGAAPGVARGVAPGVPPGTTARSVRAITPTGAAPAVRVASSTAIVPAGAELSLQSARRICVNTSRVGDRFTARLTRSLPVRGGAVIPGGARATAVITSLTGPMGEEHLAISIQSITAGGRTYSVASRVTNVELDRKAGAYRCIPDNGRISARLTQPLRISVAE